ncbi:MAG: hypothetical protein IIB82_06595 [Bacteroidetes bacterium]|nr:hypothetical protein [Bacteroidota bacterium]
MYIIYKFAYTFYVGAGLNIFDVSNPLLPVLIENFKTNLNGGFGAIGVFPFTSSGLIYVSDVDNGLSIFSFQ